MAADFDLKSILKIVKIFSELLKKDFNETNPFFKEIMNNNIKVA